jgi:hypothetical protein
MFGLLIDSINSSRLFAGIMMLLLNVGSRFVIEDISKTQQEWFSNQLMRRIVIFAICFMATKDIVTSVILTGGFIIFTQGILAEDNPLSVLPKGRPEQPAKAPAFGFVRTAIPGLPPVQNAADDQNAPVIFTT